MKTVYMIVFTGGTGDEIVDWSIYATKELAENVKNSKYKGWDCLVAEIEVIE